MARNLSVGPIVAGDEREAILVAFAELLSVGTYEELSTAAVIERSGVAPGVFAEHFEDLDDCAVAAYDFAAAKVFTAVAQRFMSTAGDYVAAGTAALRELLDYVSSVPAFTHLATLALPPDARLQRHRQEAMAQFAEFLRPGYTLGEREPPPDDRLVSEMVAGGINEIFRRYAHEGRTAELPEALPAVTYFIFSVFLGHEAAQQAVDSLG